MPQAPTPIKPTQTSNTMPPLLTATKSSAAVAAIAAAKHANTPQKTTIIQGPKTVVPAQVKGELSFIYVHIYIISCFLSFFENI